METHCKLLIALNKYGDPLKSKGKTLGKPNGSTITQYTLESLVWDRIPGQVHGTAIFEVNTDRKTYLIWVIAVAVCLKMP